MSKKEVSLCMNVKGESKVPPGFRFHPTEEELLHYYLRKKVAYQKIDLDVIREVDLNKLEPWDIQDKCRIGSTPQNDWYFFSHKDKKYPSGTRTNRATAAGFWKATGRDKVIHSRLQRIGMRKTLVFYKGRAPHGQKSDWIMHEYRLLDDHNIVPTQDSSVCDCAHEEGWVVCRVFKKKNYHKAIENPGQISKSDSREDELQSLNKDDVLEELLMEMDSISKSCKLENDNFTTTTNNNDVMQQYMNPINNILVHIPGLDSTSPTISSTLVPHAIHSADFDHGLSLENSNFVSDMLEESGQTKNVDTTNMMDYYDQCSNWADVDKFVAYQLDHHGQMGEPNQTLCFSVDDCNEPADLPRPNELDIWSLARSSMEPLYHLSL